MPLVGECPSKASIARRSWPFVAALVLFVVVLGLLPHVRFSLLVGEPAYFFSGFDEDQYSLWALGGGGPRFPHRWLSRAVFLTLSGLCGGSWDLALMLADVVFPAAGALLAWTLVGEVTRRRLPRLLLALCLLFAQELFSFGCWTIWHVGDVLGVAGPDSPVYDLRSLLGQAPHWLALLWPDYTTPFLTPFRTPEPQISRVVLFVMLGMLLAMCRAAPGAPQSRMRVGLAFLLNAGLVGTYLSQAAGLLVFEGLLSVALLLSGRWRLARLVALFAATGTASLLGGTLAYSTNRNALGLTFPSRWPVVTPSVVAAAVGLLLLSTVLRGWRSRDLYPAAAACFGSVLVLTNQQLLTGRMVLVGTWERYVDYPLVFLGGSIVAAWLVRRARLDLPRLYAVTGAALFLAGSVLIEAQDRVFEREYLVANLESVAMKRAVETVEARGLRGVTWLLVDPAKSFMLQARLQRRIDHVLDITRLFLRPVDPLAQPGGRWGLASPHRREVFEYLARRPRTIAAAERQLVQESDGRIGDVLRFLFDYRDFWAPMTDGRNLRSDDVRARIPGIRDAFARYLEDGDPCWSRPVVVLTRQAAAERVSERWHETLLVDATVGDDEPIMNMHAYLQTPAAPRAVEPGVAAGACTP